METTKHKKISKDNLIFLHKFLKAIADSIIKIFIPLYILKETGNLTFALTYLIAFNFFTIIFMLILKKVIQKYGIITIILHFLPIIIAEALLSLLNINIWLVLGAAVLMALSQTLYSIPLNLIFNFGDEKTNIAKFQVSSNIGTLIFTLISGFVISSAIKNSFLIMSVCSCIFYIVSVIPIGYSYRELKEKYELFKSKQTIKISSPTDKKFRIFHICFGLFQTTLDNLIPIFLYVNNLSFEAVTTLIALVELLKIGVNYFAKYLVKIEKQNVSCAISCIIFIVSLICIIFIKNSIALYVLSCVCSVTFPLTFVPMFKAFCIHLRNTENYFDGMTLRDVDIFLGRPIYYSLGLIGLGLIPCIALGFVATIIMLKTEVDINSAYNQNCKNDIT